MYYGHMSKESIMRSSRPFLYGIYRKYVRRACENLGVTPGGESSQEEQGTNVRLSDEDYPKEFHRITDVERKETMNSLTSDAEFMRQFGKYM